MRPDQARYDAVIVGARASGAATAMLLARAGLSVLVVDRSRYGADTLSTHALMRGGVLQLHRWGLLDLIIGAGTPPIRRTIFRYTHNELAIPIKPAHGVDALYAPRRTVLDPILVDAAAAGGAEVRFDVTASDVRRDPRGRVIGIEARDKRGRPLVVDADVVIGADGVRSTIAARVGAPIEHRGRDGGAVVYGYWLGVDTDGYEWAYRRGVATGLIPTNDGLTCVYAGSTPKQIGRGGRHVLEDIVGRASPSIAARLAAGTPPTGVRSFAGLPGYLRRAWGPGWALVGDAGSWKDPISAHGLTDASATPNCSPGRSSPPPPVTLPEHEAFAAYQSVRDQLSMPLLATADKIGAYRWDETEIGPLLLQASSAMAAEVDAIANLEPVAIA